MAGRSTSWQSRALHKKFFGLSWFHGCLGRHSSGNLSFGKELETLSRQDTVKRLALWKSNMRHDFSAKSSWINKNFFPLPAVETNTGHSGNKAEAVEALRQHWSSLQSDVHWTSHEDILECAG